MTSPVEYSETITGYDDRGEMTYRKMWGISTKDPFGFSAMDLAHQRTRALSEGAREYGMGRFLTDRHLVKRWELTTSEGEKRDITHEMSTMGGVFDFVNYSHKDHLMIRKLQEAQGRIADLEHQIAQVQQVVGEW